MNSILQEYIIDLKLNKRRSENSINSYTTDLDRYLNFVEKNYNITDPSKIEVQHIKNYILKLKRNKYQSSSIARIISSIKGFHKFLLIEKISTEDVTINLSSPKIEKKIPDVLNSEEVETLIDTINLETEIGVRNKAIIETMYATGFRASEIVDLKTNQLNMTMGFVSTISKGKKERIVPLGEIANDALKHYILTSRPILTKQRYNDYVFVNSTGEKLSRQGLWKIIKKLSIEAGISKNITPHSLRHSFATHLLQNGIDLRHLQSLLGHSDVTTTQIYTQISKNRLKYIYNEKHPRSEGE